MRWTSAPSRGWRRRFEGLGTDIYTIGSKAGYRATLTTLATATSVKEVGVMAKLSTRFGKATRAVLVLAGGALTFASVTASAAFWSISMLLWIAAALMMLTRLSWRIGRWMGPRPASQLRTPTDAVMPAQAGIYVEGSPPSGPQLSLG